MIAKKESLTQLARLVRTAVATNRLMSSREIVEVKRKIERVLSQLMILSIGYRSCSAMKTGIHCMYFHLPHVHIHLLLLSRHVCILASTPVIITPSLTTHQHSSMTTAATSNTTTVENSHGSSDQAGENRESSKIKSDITSSSKQRVNDQEKDYIFFTKAILEKVPLHGTHLPNHVSYTSPPWSYLLHYSHHLLSHTFVSTN